MSRLQPIPNIQPNGFIPSPFVTTDDVVRQMKDWEAHDKSVDLLTKYPAGPSAYALPSAPQMLTDAVNWLEQPGYSRDVVTPMAGLASYFKRAAEGKTPGALDTFMASMDIPVPGAKAMSALLGSGVLHTVFHGSPHLFDKFRMSKIGTGEGAQAYGHGLYFAESPQTAEVYQRVLSDQGGWSMSDVPIKRTVRQETIDAMNSDQLAQIEAAWAREGPEYARNIAERLIDNQRARGRDTDALFNFVREADWDATRGALYKVDIPDEAVGRMLDWDKPLPEQPESVRRGLQAIADANPHVYDDPIGLQRKVAEFETPEEAKVFWDKVRGEWFATPNKKDRFKPRLLSNRKIEYFPEGAQAFGNATGGDILESLRRTTGDDALISAAMNNAGIPGIRYFDQSSRTAGEGTRNLVLFDESLAKIMERK